MSAFEVMTPSVPALETIGKEAEDGLARRSRSKSRMLGIAGLAAATVLGVALLSRENPTPVSHVQAAKTPAVSQGASKPESRLEPVTTVGAATTDGAATTEPRAVSAPAAVVSADAKSARRATRVTVRTQPPGAVIYDERQRIGRDIAEVRVLRGQKRKLIALLNRHHPAHVVVDGSVETLEVELKPMDAKELARATAYARAR